jgi:hypothetical protein
MTPMLQRQIHLLTGKGGVGKSLASCVLAHLFERKGLNTLLVQLHAEDSHSRYLDVSAITDTLSQVHEHLWVVNIDPAKALSEYITLKIKFERLTEAFIKRPIVQHFLNFLPAMAELNMLGKVWYHAEEIGEHQRPRFDRIVVDCPPSGHALKFVDVARTIFSVSPGGIMGDETRRMMHTFQDPDRSCLHVVTGLEELMLQETVELIALAEKSATAPLGFLICNGVQEPLFEPKDLPFLKERQQKAEAQDLVPLLKIAHTRAQMEARQGKLLQQLKGVRSNMPMVLLPLIEKSHLGKTDIIQLADWFSQQHNGEEALS